MAVLAVVHYRSFLAAAASLKLSQPAMSRIIRGVEEALGVKLFTRSTRQVIVTEAGKAFALFAQRQLNDLKINLAHLRSMVEQPRTQIVVASVFSLADAMLPALVANYCSQFPRVELHLREGLHTTVRDEVRSGIADFGIGYIEDAAETFASEVMMADSLYVIAPRGHVFASRKSVSLQALASRPLVSFPVESQTRQSVDQAAAAAGISLKYLMTTNRLSTLHSLVRNGVGAAVVPRKERPSSADREIIVRPLAVPGLARRVGLLRLRERELTPAAEAFLDVVRKWIRDMHRL